MPFVIPLDENLIKEIFGNTATYTNSDNKTLTVSFDKTDEGGTSSDQYSYDLETGWLIEVRHSRTVDGVVVEKFEVEAISFTGSEESEPGIPELTPIPLWSFFLTFLVFSLISKRKR